MKENNIEVRILPKISGFETRAQETTASGSTTSTKEIIGYASVFNQESKPLQMWNSAIEEYVDVIEIIEPTAFNNADLSSVIYDIDHNPSSLIARTEAGNLNLEVTENGLLFRAIIPNTTKALDLFEDVKVGNYYENSFAFRVREGGDKFTKRPDGVYERRIFDIEYVRDVSTCVNGAYANTTVTDNERKINIKLEVEPVQFNEIEQSEFDFDNLFLN